MLHTNSIASFCLSGDEMLNYCDNLTGDAAAVEVEVSAVEGAVISVVVVVAVGAAAVVSVVVVAAALDSVVIVAAIAGDLSNKRIKLSLLDFP